MQETLKINGRTVRWTLAVDLQSRELAMASEQATGDDAVGIFLYCMKCFTGRGDWMFRSLSMRVMVVGALLPLAIAQANAQTAVDPFLERRVEALATSDGQGIGPYKIASKSFIKRFYSLRNFRPAWNSSENFRTLSRAIAAIASHGLLMRDFYPEALGLALPKPKDRRLTGAERDIVLTDALIRLLYQLYYGKVDPKRFDANWNFKRKAPAGNTAQRISSALDSDRLDTIIAEATPNGPNHERLRAGLRAYRAYAAKGAWPIVAAGGVIKPGDQNPAVAAIRLPPVSTALSGYGASPILWAVFDRLQQAGMCRQCRIWTQAMRSGGGGAGRRR